MRSKLLLADDSLTVQRVIELTFADEDLDVSTVGDGGQAIAHIERDRPDIVLADLTMPVRDGYGVAAHVKRSPALASQTRVVLLTGAFEPVDQERVDVLGVDGVLTKPFQPRAAIELVRTLLAKPPRARQPISADGAARDEEAGDATRSSADAAAGAGSGARSAPDELDDYFRRLDEALTSAGLVASSAVRDMLAESKAKVATSSASSGGGTAGASNDSRPSVAGGGELQAVTAIPAPAAAVPGAASSPAPPPAFAVTEELIEAVAQRVIDRLGDGIVREVVSARVVDIAERLVREEIERIKAAADLA